MNLTVSQRQRLMELSAPEELLDREFVDSAERDAFYKKTEMDFVKQNREKLRGLLADVHKPILCRTQERLIRWLTEEEGFTQVATPAIITSGMLSKMNIDADHALREQVFWLDSKHCLRPMLAPNLYEMMRDIHKITNEPVRIFEVGSCFRKESQGSQHLNEFTMLNLVELAGVEDGEQMERLKDLSRRAMEALGIQDYRTEITGSGVYGETLDIVCGDLELASGAYGPHFLDSQWGVFDTWVGLGIGVERVAMTVGDHANIKRVGRSLAYLDGIRLNI